MFLNKVRKRVRFISLLLLFLMAFNSPATQLFGEMIMKAFAASTDSMTTKLTPTYGGFSLVGDKYYSKTSYLSGGKIDVTVPEGKVISKIFHGSQDITPSAAIGLNSYSGLVNDINGTRQEVTSLDNKEGSQGYYAWYRYIPGGSQGKNWYADVPDINGDIVKISCGPDDFGPASYRSTSNADTETIKGISMPKLPGCSTTDFSKLEALSLGSTKDQPFKLSGIEIPDSAVTDVEATSARVNTDLQEPIKGPDNNHIGYPREDIIWDIHVAPNKNDAGEYRVTFQQSFEDFEDGYDSSRELANPPNGAKVITYYAAFIVDLKGTTYQYDSAVTVQYEDAVISSTPDLRPIGLTSGASCIEAGKDVTYTYKIRNTGAATTTTFRTIVELNGSEVASMDTNGLDTNDEKQGTFTYNFPSAGSYTFKVIVDSNNAVDEGAGGENNNTLTQAVTVQSAGGCSGSGGGGDGGGTTDPPDPTGTMTGKVWPDKDFINWKDSNLVWFEVEEKGCTLVKYKYEFKGKGGVWNWPPLQVGWYNSNGETKKAQPFSYDTATRMYPSNIQDGQVEVRVTVVDSCGTESVIGPGTFTIGPPPPKNPPELKIAFTDPADGSEINQAILGERVDLKVIKMKDPDGDPLTFQWDFTSSEPTAWIKGLPAKYGWKTPYNSMSYNGMIADVAGLQLVCATASNTVHTVKSCANLDVIPPNPVPKIKGQQVIKVGRPIGIPWDASDSYSPVKGRTIDHSRDEWTNAKTSYTNPGEEIIKLNVFDNTGMKSLAPDTWKLTVIPDLPPVIDFLYSSTVSRIAPSTFRNNSYSPDGDTIVKYETWYGYDVGNNGSCNPYENKISSDNRNFEFKPTKVGKYCFRLYAEEDYGLNSTANYTVEVVNDNPDVTFKVSGNSIEPTPFEAVPMNPQDMLNNDAWTTSTLDKPNLNKRMWSITPDGTLATSPRYNLTADPYGYNIGGSIKADQNLTYPHSPNSVSLVGSLVGSNAELGTKNPIYYLGDGMFIYTLYGWTYRNKMEWYLAGTKLPAPIRLYTSDFYDTSAFVYVREDLNEIILLDTGGSWNSYQNVHYKRYKISELKAGNTIAAYSFSRNYVVSNREFPDYGKDVVFSDGSQATKIQEMIKTTTGYKRINLNTRTIESYTFDNLTTPYKVESYDHIPSFRADPVWNSGVLYQTSPYFSEVFRSPGGKVFGSALMYGEAWSNTCYHPYWDEAEQQLKIIPACNLNVPTAISSDDNYVLVTESGYTPRSLIQNVKTGQLHAYNCWEVGGHYSDTEYDDEGNPKWIPGDTVCEWQPQLPAGVAEELLNYNQTSIDGYSKEPIDGYTPIFKVIPDWYYHGEYWIGNAKTKELIWKPQGTCEKPPIVVEPGLFVYCGNVYRFDHEESHLPGIREFFTYGQFIKPNQPPIINGSINWTMRINNLKYDYVPAGMSFRIQDHQNMYRVESMKNRLRLVKIVNGEKTILAEKARSLLPGVWNTYSVKLTGSEIKVYQDGVPYFTVNDSTFLYGSTGPYSIHESTEFKAMSAIAYSPYITNKTYGAAVVDTQVVYETTFDDPEGDPRFDNGTQWKYTHVDPFMFLDARDGKSGWSSKNGALVTTPILSFDKVGSYKIEYRAPDDPHPDHRLSNGDTTFQGYSKYSNWYTQQLIVHRAPIVNFTVSQAGNGTIQWNDYSYDPDHCYDGNSSSCQNGYQTDRGIKFEKYFYVTPSGNTVTGKLVHPPEPGTYIVVKAVGDEYYAWSDWMDQTITVNCNPCTPNHPPTVNLTFPNGGFTNPNPVSLRPTVTWDQNDIDPGTIFTVFDLEIRDIYGNCYECVYNRSMNTPNTSWAWTMDTPLLMGGQYQVRVRISDGEEFSAWSQVGWMITNRPPVTYMSFPFGTQANPTYVTTTRPQFIWTQSDPDPGTIFTYFQLQVANAANGIVLDTGNIWQGTSSTTGYYTPSVDMPTNEPLAVRVQASDGYAWSGFSPDAWMVINRPPSVTLTYPNGTQAAPNIVETNTPTVTWNQMDLDVRAVFNYFQVQVLNESGLVVVDSGKVWQGTSATSGSWTVNTPLPAGQKLQFRVSVWDQYDAWSGWSNTGWLYINRPPSGNITFATPIYENDTPSFTVSATDPDGDALSIIVESSFNGAPFSVIQQWSNVPSGQDKIFTYGPLPKGNYTLRLTLDDGYGGTYEQTYSFVVLPLNITGWVTHTPEWESYRQSWNAKHPTDQRAASVFWAGEAFVLSAAVTDTGTSTTKPVSVTSKLLTTSENVTLSSSNLVNYSGELLNTDHDRLLSNGNHTFRFTVQWSNGLVQTYDVLITIKGVIWDVIVNQIRH
ncbi:CARDB domain-containing protein [Paenibacillus allorhizosphaerae]|uniref:CARDB domain-containing protein n=1 Tax=Paenibacillus allorhizosphaerae TaxID=2849866 RepID=A0ABN7TWT7_9BACL|nr:CARDB domain-containing protein [Paenibacillus allorhizosphaerae]CAG7658875.1 hypothetical protein PAECIP111802_07197 [Paenibacillus allorhizosphaerae]